MPVKIRVENFYAYFGSHRVLKGINLTINSNEIFSIIGPAHSGKTTLLRAMNRMNEEAINYRQEGKIYLDNQDISSLDKNILRRRIGMIFATPTPLPNTIFNNVAYGPRLKGIKAVRTLHNLVEKSLRQASLWEEVKDRLSDSALHLSGGQQQRLCIARALAVEPEVLLMDEPCSGLDPISTAKIEETLRQLKKEYTIILVTNNTRQAARVADNIAFFLAGELIEIGTPEMKYYLPDRRIKEPMTTLPDEWVKAKESTTEGFKLVLQQLNVYYGEFHAIINVCMKIATKTITAIIGPSGCGKSTLLRSLNRMNELIEGAQITGKIYLDGKDIYEIDVFSLRKKVGMVFQRPNPFSFSIFDNIAYGPRIHGEHRKEIINEIVEESLRAVNLWSELKDRLRTNALTLTDEQKQRLCIARALAVKPEVLLMDEPCSTLDPIATLHIEELLRSLAQKYTIVIVTHNMQQAARVSEYTGFMLLGELVEFDKTTNIFTSPKDKRTEDFLLGRFG